MTLLSVLNFFTLVGVLPLASWLLMTRYKKSIHAKDVYLLRVTTINLAFAGLLFGFAPSIAWVVLAIMFISLGYGIPALVRSLLTTITAPKDQAVMHSLVSMTSYLGATLAAPVFGTIFAAVLKVGGTLLGMPFFTSSIVFTVAAILFTFVKPQTGK